MNNEPLIRYIGPDDANQALCASAAGLGTTEFACVRNLDYVPTPFEVYPLAQRVHFPLERVVAFAVDMDGTSTTTEPLALHALEYMVRRFTGLLTPEQWPGLDPVLDHPFVIGNSNFRHTEFLIERYRDRLDRTALCQAFFEAVAWTLTNMADTARVQEVRVDARNAGLAQLLDDAEFRALTGGGVGRSAPSVTSENVAQIVAPFVRRHGGAFKCDQHGLLVSAALDLYYMRYHDILRRVAAGQGGALAAQLLGDADRRLIDAMPAYDVFLALIKGWLGSDVDAVYERVREQAIRSINPEPAATALDAGRERMRRLAEAFERRPAKLGLVTASIAFETHAVMREVIRRVAESASGWAISGQRKDRILAGLADYRAVFDGFINASDACEHRLKPHRDLYSLALHQMAVPKAEYRHVVGLEDTEPGVVSLRAAGVGCAVALPNHDTGRQKYDAAAEVVNGGLPELLLLREVLAERRS